MPSGQIISQGDGDRQILLLGGRRLALGLGPVLLPLTRVSLARLSDVLVTIARDFEHYSQDGRVYVSCEKLVLRLDRDEFIDLLGLVSQALTWLQDEGTRRLH
jgi:hypothetical protein